MHVEPSGVEANCCSPFPSDRATTLDEIQSQELSPEASTLRATGFRLLLVEGVPLNVSRWIAAAGVEAGDLERVLADRHARGRVQFDEEGSLVGIAGLTVEPTRHRVEIDGLQRWTWCALDAVGILGALGATGLIHSTDPATGQDIRIRFSNGRADADAALFVLGGFSDADVTEEWCPMVNFFTTHESAHTWARERDLIGEVLSVRAVADQAAEIWRPVVDDSQPQSC